MRLIDADAFENKMYSEAFEKDSDMQRWDSGCWIRYKLFEKVLREQPTVNHDNSLQKLSDEIAKFKRTMRSSNSDYLTGYLSALSAVEGMIAEMMPHELYEEVTT